MSLLSTLNKSLLSTLNKSLLSTLNKSNCVLPKFLAEDPDRLPLINVGEEDIVNFFMSISDIKESLSSLHKITSE